MQTVHQPARVALKLREVRAGIALRAYGSVAAGVSIQAAVDDLEVGRILVQTHLKVEGNAAVKDHFPELDVEDAVGRGPRYGGKYPLPVGAVRIVQVGPIWSNQVGHHRGGQGAIVNGRLVATCKLQVAVGRDVGRSESLIVKGNREGQRDVSRAIIAMVASIGGAGHDGAGGGGNRIIVGRARACRRRRRRRCCCAGLRSCGCCRRCRCRRSRRCGRRRRRPCSRRRRCECSSSCRGWRRCPCSRRRRRECRSSRSCCRSRRCRCRTRTGHQVVPDSQPIAEAGRATREGRSLAGAACLHPGRLITATVRTNPVEDVKEA